MSAFVVGGCVGAAATALFVGLTTFGVGLIADLASDAADAVRRARRKAREARPAARGYVEARARYYAAE